MFAVLFFVSNVHIYIKYLFVLPFEVGEKGMRCSLVKMRFLVYMFLFSRGNRAPSLGRESGGCYLLCEGGLGWISEDSS